MADLINDIKTAFAAAEKNVGNIDDRMTDLGKTLGNIAKQAIFISDKTSLLKTITDKLNEGHEKLNKLRSLGLGMDTQMLNMKLLELKMQRDLIGFKVNSLQKEAVAATGQHKIDLESKIRELMMEGKLSQITSKYYKNRQGSYSKQISDQKKYNDQLSEAQSLFDKENETMEEFRLVWTKIFEIFKAIDEESFNLRKNFGIYRDQNKDIQKWSLSISQNLASQGISIKDSNASAFALASSFGRVSSINKDIIADVALLSTQLGVSTEESSKLLNTLAIISGKTLVEAKEVSLGFAQSLSAAAGTNLPDIIKDISQLSDNVRTTFRGNTIELIKATVEARRFGLSIGSLGKSAESLLDFNSSVNAEMEASVLIGQNINLVEARRLAFVGDLAGQQKEILRVVKSIGDFDKLNMMQKKAISTATGMSVEDLQTMLQREKEIEHVRSNGSDEAKKLLSSYEDMKKMQKDKIVDLEKEFMIRTRTEQNQNKIKAIQDNINQLWQKLVENLLPVIEKGMEAIVFLSGALANGLGKGLVIWSGVIKFTGIFSKSLATASGFISKIFGPIMGFFKIGKIGLKAIPVLGEIIMAVELIFNLFKRWGGLIDDVKSEKKGILRAILEGIWSIVPALYDVLVQPFIDAFNWIWKGLGFGGESPSKLGNLIVDGISSIGSMLLGVLTSPFKLAYDAITSIFGKLPEFITSVFKKGIDFAMQLPGIGFLMKAVGITGSEQTSQSSKSSPETNKPSVDPNQMIINKLDELIQLMKNGGISVNMDGRKVSQALAIASS